MEPIEMRRDNEALRRGGGGRWFKWQRRAGLVVANSANNLLPMLLTPLLSLLVIRQTSAAVWGGFVPLLILVQLGGHVVAWGNDTYLLREFSRNPAQLAEAWQSCWRTRLLLLGGLVVGLLLWQPEVAVWLVVWAVGLMWQQSCAVLVTYKRDFAFAAGVELVGLVGMVTAVAYWGPTITTDRLIHLFALVTLAKAVVLWGRYRAITLGGMWGGAGNGRFQLAYFTLSWPFFLLGFVGMLNSRIDLYLVNAYFPPEAVGKYQIFTSFLLYIQTVAAFILVPFVKTFYRLPYTTIRKIARRLFGLGGLIVPVAMVALFFLLPYVYGIYLPAAFFWLGGLAAWPLFYFSPIIYALYKSEKETAVLWINLVSILLALLLNALFLPRYGLIGPIFSMFLIQWLMLFVYDWQGRRMLVL